MKKWAAMVLLLATPAFAQTQPAVKEPVCEPIGRTSKGDLVYSMECRNIPGLAPGINGYDPLPQIKTITVPIKPETPESK